MGKSAQTHGTASTCAACGAFWMRMPGLEQRCGCGGELVEMNLTERIASLPHATANQVDERHAEEARKRK